MVSKRQKQFIVQRSGGKGNRKIKSSRRWLRGGRRFLAREFSFGMKKKIRFRTDFQPLILVYGIVSILFLIILGIIYGDFQSIPWLYYILLVFGLVFVDIYILGTKRFDSS